MMNSSGRRSVQKASSVTVNSARSDCAAQHSAARRSTAATTSRTAVSAMAAPARRTKTPARTLPLLHPLLPLPLLALLALLPLLPLLPCSRGMASCSSNPWKDCCFMVPQSLQGLLLYDAHAPASVRVPPPVIIPAAAIGGFGLRFLDLHIPHARHQLQHASHNPEPQTTLSPVSPKPWTPHPPC